MNKAWRVVSVLALACFLLGLAGIAVGFFTGSSPMTIVNHGALTDYLARLESNRDILMSLLGL